MSQRDKILIAAAATLVAVVGGWFVMAKPKRAEMRSLDSQIATMRTEVNGVAAKAAEYRAARDTLRSNPQVFRQAGKALPIPTQIVIVVGTFLRNWWWAIIPAIVLFVAWFRRRGRNPAVRRVRDTRLLRTPLLGDLIAKVEIARFARTLSTLLGNGVTLLAGLAIVKETMANVVLASGFDGVIAKLREGKGFGRPMAETGLYPRLATQMILVGEESGRLEEMLARVADVYDREVATSIKRFLAVLEPVLILSLAVLVGGIVFSILLGVMGMSELVV